MVTQCFVLSAAKIDLLQKVEALFQRPKFHNTVCQNSIDILLITESDEALWKKNCLSGLMLQIQKNKKHPFILFLTCISCWGYRGLQSLSWLILGERKSATSTSHRSFTRLIHLDKLIHTHRQFNNHYLFRILHVFYLVRELICEITRHHTRSHPARLQVMCLQPPFGPIGGL